MTMILATTDFIAGKAVTEYKGFVQGSTVQSKHIGRDFMAGLKTIVGGEIKGYTEMMESARQVAIQRMIQDAEQKGANAIIGVKFQTSAVMQGASEIMAYGTAVVVE